MLVKRLQICSAFLWFICVLPAFGQVANDACKNAQDLGKLPNPQICNPSGSGGGEGTRLSFSGSNKGAKFEADAPIGVSDCKGGPQTVPAADVWYTFIASGNSLRIELQSAEIKNLGYTLWIGSCNNFNAIACEMSGPAINAIIGSIAQGERYYLQIHGRNLSDVGAFNLNITNSNSCDICVLNTVLTVTPKPVDGYYKAGQQIDFCFSVSEFEIVSNNWFHGVEIDFGNFYDLSSLQTTPAVSCRGNGKWAWFNSVTSRETGKEFGPGFFYESDGSPTNPGDNFGDKCEGKTPWRFCWKIRTKEQVACKQGGDLGIIINTLSDGESGAWLSKACVSDPDIIFISAQDCCEKPTVTATNACAGLPSGKITVTGYGTGPWVYEIRDVSNTLVEKSPSLNSNFTSKGLPAGTYIAYAKDAVGCEKFTLIDIVESSPPSVSITSLNPLCATSCNGRGNVAVTGGTPPYVYKWSNSETTALVTNLCADIEYTVSISDNVGCVIEQKIKLNKPPIFKLEIASFTDVSCFDACNGKVTFNQKNGIVPIRYLWSDGSTVQNRTDLCGPKSYKVTATDANGCIADTTVTTTSPIKLTISANIQDENCESKNGRISLVATGGTPPLIYLWSNGTRTAINSNLEKGIYSVSITDSKGCLNIAEFEVKRTSNLQFTTKETPVSCFGGSNGVVEVASSNAKPPFVLSVPSGQAGNPLTGLKAGTYVVTLIDADRCSAERTITITSPDSIEARPSILSVQCFGESNGSISLNPIGGKSPYTYSWADGSTSNSIIDKSAGNYAVTIRDQASCTQKFTIKLTEPGKLEFDFVIAPVACFGESNGSVSGSMSGGNSPFQYAWFDGNTNLPRLNMSAGIYAVTARDSKGCTQDTTIEILQPSSLLTASITQLASIKCFQDSTARIEAFGSGGVTPYVYTWSDMLSIKQRNSIPAGNYIVTVRDAYNCQKTASINIQQPDSISANPVIKDAICESNSGSILVNTLGGTGPYSYNWDGFSVTSNILDSLFEGTYTVRIDDANNCSNTFEFIVQKSGFIKVRAIIDSTSCPNSTDGKISASIFNGTPPYQFTWSNSSNAAVIGNLAAGKYSVSAVDKHLCRHDTVFEVFAPVASEFEILPTIPRCFGESNGKLEVLSIANVQNPVSFIWSNGINQRVNSGIPAGLYSVTILDNKKCSYEIQTELLNPEPIVVNSGRDRNIPENSFIVTDIEITPPSKYSIVITPDSGLIQIDSNSYQIGPLKSIIYFVEVVNPLGCIGYDTLKIGVININTVVIPNAFSPNNDGVNDEYILISDFETDRISYRIYNRWGQKVFESKSLNSKWDGRDLSGNKVSIGTYVLIVEYVDPTTNKVILESRNISLLR